MHHPQNWHSSS